MWRHIAQSTPGDSHRADDVPCQDSGRVAVLGGDSDQTLLACVADGAGSAHHSAIGSALACEAVVDSATAYFAQHGSFANLHADDIVQWCDVIRAKLSDAAAARGAEVRELATTLCAAIISANHACFFQIGDGAIVLKSNGVCGVAFWPQSGEYANTTNFLTSNDYREHLQIFSTTTRFSDVALFTDGIERLALRFDGRTPHLPFFEPFFQALRSGDTSRDFGEDLRKFLESDSVRSRSDDDKTFILASRISY